MKFRDKLSGCVYEFTHDNDIVSMLEHDGYEVVQEKVEEEKPVKKESKKE
jgi:hypothetical protein